LPAGLDELWMTVWKVVCVEDAEVRNRAGVPVGCCSRVGSAKAEVAPRVSRRVLDKTAWNFMLQRLYRKRIE